MGKLDRCAKSSWALLPWSFRRIRLELVLDTCSTDRSRAIGYLLVAPLTQDGRIDALLWREYREFCGVICIYAEGPSDVGHLLRTARGTWAFRYDVTRKPAKVPTFHLGSDRFVIGDYASIRDDCGQSLFRVAAIEPM
jgi:hypothetical protein